MLARHEHAHQPGRGGLALRGRLRPLGVSLDVNPSLQPGLTQQPTSAGSGALSTRSRAIGRTSGATTAGRTPSARAISLGEQPSWWRARTRVSSS